MNKSLEEQLTDMVGKGLRELIAQRNKEEEERAEKARIAKEHLENSIKEIKELAWIIEKVGLSVIKVIQKGDEKKPWYRIEPLKISNVARRTLITLVIEPNKRDDRPANTVCLFYKGEVYHKQQEILEKISELIVEHTVN